MVYNNYTRPMQDPGVPGGGYGAPYGGAGGGLPPNAVPMAQNASQGGGVIDYTQLLENPREFVINAMLSKNINPFGTGMLTRATLNRAPDLVAQLYPQIFQGALSSGGDVLGRLPDMIGDLVQRAVGGQSVFMSPGQAQGTAQNLAGLAASLRSTPNDPMNQAQQLARTILSDPNQSSGLLSSLLYGGVNDRLGDTLRGGLRDAGFMAQRQAQRTGQDISFLEMLLSGGLSNPNIFGR